MIDSARIRKELCEAFEKGTLQTEYDLTDFYREPEITAQDLEKQKIPQKLEEVRKRGITLKLNKKTIPLTEQMLASSVDDQGEFDPELIAEWVADLEREYSTIYQPVDFTNVHGQHLRYKNVGNYGWFIDIKQSAKKLLKN